MKKISFNIDVVGSCDLKCPSCPVGNSPKNKKKTGSMSPDLLESILNKASKELEFNYVGLYNWAEPLLHPKLPELVEIVERYAPCHLSSNLNLEKIDYEAIIMKKPRHFRISLSGFNQSIYSRSHQGGDIEKVKRNMIKLAEANDKFGRQTKIEVLYHRYVGNIDDELLMRQFAASLGFLFQPVWAYLMPVEKIIAYLESPEEMSQKDLDLISMLALPPSNEVMRASRKVKNDQCVLLEHQITLDSAGNVHLCCGVFDTEKFKIGNFLDINFEELQSEKRSMQYCNKCMDFGVHNLITYSSKDYDVIARKNIIARTEKILDNIENKKSRVRIMAEKITSKLRSKIG